MAVTNINFRVDEDLKRDAESICQDIGMNMTTAITIFLKRMVRENGIPFEVSADPFYSESNIKALKKALDDYNADRIEFEHHDIMEV